MGIGLLGIRLQTCTRKIMEEFVSHYITVWQTVLRAIILYLGFLVGLISQFKKLGKRDLNTKSYIKIC